MAKRKTTPADDKFIAEYLNGANIDFSATKVIKRTNRFSGEEVEVDPVAAAAYDFVMKIEPILYNAAALQKVHPKLKPTNSVSNFDRARMLVLKLDQNAYMTLLD